MALPGLSSDELSDAGQAPGGPEVEHDDLAAHLFDRDGAAGDGVIEFELERLADGLDLGHLSAGGLGVGRVGIVALDAAQDLDRLAMFKNCVFYNAVESTATTMSQAFSVNNSAGGMVLLQNCTLIGATDWAAANNGNVYISDAAPTAGTSGIAIAVTR